MRRALALARFSVVLAAVLTAHVKHAAGLDDVVLQTLLNDLSSHVDAVRQQAAARLGGIADTRATAGLVKALADDAPPVRREAAKALGAIKDPRSVVGLITALDDADHNVRFYAAYALGEIKDPRATEPLLTSLRDTSWSVRNQAAWALRGIGGAQLTPRLVDMLSQQGVDVRQLAWILQHLDRKAVLAHLDTVLRADSVSTRERGIIVFGVLQDPQAVPALLRSLDDVSPRIRRRAASLLADMRDGRALEPLINTARRDVDESVRKAAKAAVEALSQNKDLMAYWSFDQVQNGVARDLTGNGNDGQVKGCTTVPGRSGQALQFGPGRFVELGRPPEIPIGNAPFTVTAWVKTEATEGVVVARGGAFCGFALYVKDGLPKFGIHREQQGPGFIAAGAPLSRGDWVHLAGVVRKNRIELYVAGHLAASTETAGYLPGDCGQGMEIGFDVGNSPCEIVTPLAGVIDEVKVFGVALTPDQIQAEAKQ